MNGTIFGDMHGDNDDYDDDDHDDKLYLKITR